MQRISVSKMLWLTIAVVLLTIFSFATTSSPVSAKKATKTVNLQVDCKHLSAEVLKQAQARGDCPQSNAINTLKPFDTRAGACGTTSLYITDNFNGGTPTITIAASSSKGYMISVSWSVKWVNYDTGGQNGYGGSQGYFGDNWSRSDNPFTGVGSVYAILDNLTVTTGYGYICYGLQPQDSGYVD